MLKRANKLVWVDAGVVGCSLVPEDVMIINQFVSCDINGVNCLLR